MTELYSITLLGSTSIKVVRKTLMKLRAGVNFIIIIIKAAFETVDLRWSYRCTM